jgi:DNA-binding NarL/FixJ family response regulator
MAFLCRAEVARFDERDEAASWDAVAGTFDVIERPFAAAYARYRAAAAILRDRGPRPDAAAALAASRSTAARLGAVPLLTEIERLARQARLDLAASYSPAADRGADGAEDVAHDLTAREIEVLGLIAAGWSNQQIADALFISRKTASVHASHIFDKLGAANRVDAAAIARRLGVEAGPAPPGTAPTRG